MMNEALYGLIGAAVAFFASRFGLPLAAPKPKAPNNEDLGGVIRAVLLEVLKGIAQPKQDDEVRKHLKQIVGRMEAE
jgi:hypothetical protein